MKKCNTMHGLSVEGTAAQSGGPQCIQHPLASAQHGPAPQRALAALLQRAGLHGLRRQLVQVPAVCRCVGRGLLCTAGGAL